MSGGKMIIPLGTARHFDTSGVLSSSCNVFRGHTVSSVNWAKRCNARKPSYIERIRSRGESWLTVRASAKSNKASISAQVTETDGELLKDSKIVLQRVADWEKAKKYEKSGEIYEGKVDKSKSGGLLVRFHSLQGFLPYTQMIMPKDRNKPLVEVINDLIGSTVSVKVSEVNEEEKKLIFSQKLAMWEKYIDQVNVGDVFEGKVNSLVEFGAFVYLRFPDGSYHIEGLVHKSEISWDLVRDVKDFLIEGETVRVKVVNIDKRRSRMELSIKQLQTDPLFETLDTLMPPEGINMGVSNADVGVPNEQLPGLEQICEELRQEEGILDVKIGRQALEKRVVSQDLELWLSHLPGENGRFTLLARAGRQVQEVLLHTFLDREGIKQAVQRVKARVP